MNAQQMFKKNLADIHGRILIVCPIIKTSYLAGFGQGVSREQDTMSFCSHSLLRYYIANGPTLTTQNSSTACKTCHIYVKSGKMHTQAHGHTHTEIEREKESIF